MMALAWGLGETEPSCPRWRDATIQAAKSAKYEFVITWMVVFALFDSQFLWIEAAMSVSRPLDLVRRLQLICPGQWLRLAKSTDKHASDGIFATHRKV